MTEMRDAAVRQPDKAAGQTYALIYVGDRLAELIEAFQQKGSAPLVVPPKSRVKNAPIAPPPGITTDPVTEEEKGRSK